MSDSSTHEASTRDIAALQEQMRTLASQINLLRNDAAQAMVAPGKREAARLKTRALALDAAREIWAQPGSYETGDMRTIAKHMGRSTGSLFAHFRSKADLWRAAMGYEPPVDCFEVRELLKAAAARGSKTNDASATNCKKKQTSHRLA